MFIVQIIRLRDNYEITYGVIKGYQDAGWRSVGGDFSFEFQVGDSLINDITAEPNALSKYHVLFIGRTFPVIYDPNNVKNNTMLITPQAFELYDIPYPDSLNWVRQYQ